MSYSKDNPFCIDGKPIIQFQEEAKRWETDTEGWIAEWRDGRLDNCPLVC